MIMFECVLYLVDSELVWGYGFKYVALAFLHFFCLFLFSFKCVSDSGSVPLVWGWTTLFVFI